MFRFDFRIIFFAAALIAAFISAGSAADDEFVNLNCKMGDCDWYRLANRIEIKPTETGKLVGATFYECTTKTKSDDEYPRSYQCKPTEITPQDYVANCSISAPSLAFKDRNGKWQRTKLSISEDAEFGFNLSAINAYLRICHGFVRKHERLDMIGAKFGYQNRAKEIAGTEHDTVNLISDLASERPISEVPTQTSNVAPIKQEEGFQTPSHNIFCQVFRGNKPYFLRCDIMSLEGSIPPRPRNCKETDWGQAFEVSENDLTGRRICYTDTVMSETLETLPYGVAFRSKEFTCKSEPVGVTCINTYGHGFFISKRVQNTF